MRTKRIDLIETFIEQEKSVSLDTLCEKFNVSKNTIRRDIDDLVKKGTVEKVYGGVVSTQQASDKRSFRPSYSSGVASFPHFAVPCPHKRH